MEDKAWGDDDDCTSRVGGEQEQEQEEQEFRGTGRGDLSESPPSPASRLLELRVMMMTMPAKTDFSNPRTKRPALTPTRGVPESPERRTRCRSGGYPCLPPPLERRRGDRVLRRQVPPDDAEVPLPGGVLYRYGRKSLCGADV